MDTASLPTNLPPESTTSAASAVALAPGPYWTSFEQFRVGSTATLESIKPGTVGTLMSKAGMFRILKEDDFQRLLGLATEVTRLKLGARYLVKAAKVYQKHGDEESRQLLFESLSMLTQFPLLPERDGQFKVEVTPEEQAENEEEVDLTAIPRPQF